MTMGTEKSHGAKHEKRDFHMDFVWIFVWSLLGLMVAGLALSFLLFAGYNRLWLAGDTQPSRLAAGLPTHPPGPRLQEKPAQDLTEFHARESETLNSYGWVEPNAGVVHIPIDRAMDLVLQRGLPVRENQSNGESRKGDGKVKPMQKTR